MKSNNSKKGMKTKHVMVSVLDVAELLPFVATKADQFDECMEGINNFVSELQDSYGKNIHYIGQDIVGEKFMQRFIFEGEGFMEILFAPPAAIGAHFVTKKTAKKFKKSLEKTLKKTLPTSSAAKLLIKSVEIIEEKGESLTIRTWKKLKKLREKS